VSHQLKKEHGLAHAGNTKLKKAAESSGFLPKAEPRVPSG
jgi:hypothetical protein